MQTWVVTFSFHRWIIYLLIQQQQNHDLPLYI
jgi:hypothetical protein